MRDDHVRSIFKRATLGLALVTPDGRWLHATPARCRLLGDTARELLAGDCPAITAAGDPDPSARPRPAAAVGQLLAAPVRVT